MKNSTIFFTLMFAFIYLFPSSAFAQDVKVEKEKAVKTDSVCCKKHEKSSTCENKKCNCKECKKMRSSSEKKKSHSKEWNFKDINVQIPKLSMKNPFVEVSYGLGNSSVNSLIGKFQDAGFAEIKIGHYRNSLRGKDSVVLGSKSKFVQFSFFDQKLRKAVTTSDISTNTFRFGMGWADALGYKFGNSALLLGSEQGFGWSRLKVNDKLTDVSDLAKLRYYDNQFKFGINNAATLKFSIVPSVAVNVSYERAQVYQKVIFWRTAGSILAEQISYGILDEFIDEVVDHSSVGAPVINFILRNGLSYGIYELRKEKMNFPFKGEDPLMESTFKVGLSFQL